MARFVRFVTAVMACLVCTPAAPAQSRVDALGDPLPEGAIARLGTTRMRHFSTPDHYCSGIGSIAWSPDGKMIATTSYSDKIGVEARLWEASTGKPLSLLENNLRYGPSFVRFAPDSNSIAAAARDKIVLWNVATGKELGQLVGHQGDVDSLVFQDGGKTIVSVSRDGAVYWWDVAGRKTTRQWQLLADDPTKTEKGEPILLRGVRDTCFSADGKTLAVAKWWSTKPKEPWGAKRAIVYDLNVPKEIWREDGNLDSFLFAFEPDGKRLALSREGTVRLQETATGRPLANAGWLLASRMDFSPDGKTVAICTGDCKVLFWSPDDKTPLREAESPLHDRGHNACPAFAPDGKKLAIDRDSTFQVLDVATGKPVVSWPSYDEGFRDLAFSADGRNLFADRLTIDTASWRQRAPEDPLWKKFGYVQSVSTDRALCIAAEGKHKDALFDMKTGRVLARLQAPARDPGLHEGFFSAKASLYVMQDRSCAGKEVDTVFAIPSGKRLWQLSFNQHVGTGCWTFSADESRVAFFELSTEMIHVHDTATGKLLGQFGKYSGNYPGSVTLALSPNGNMLAVSAHGLRNAQIWDLRTGKIHRSLVLDQEARRYACLLWSADHRMLTVGGLDNSVRLWEVASEQVRREFRGHLARASCLAFSPDGQILASGSEDTTLLIWKTLPGKKGRHPLTEIELSARWGSLAADAGQAYEAQADLLDDPERAVPFLAKRVQPAPTLDPKRVAALIEDLDSPRFPVRAKAAKELEGLGELACTAIGKALAGKPSLETRRALELLLEQGNQLTPSQLRSLRAIEVLEKVGTPDAVRILEVLAQGNPDCVATAESRTVVARMKNRK